MCPTGSEAILASNIMLRKKQKAQNELIKHHIICLKAMFNHVLSSRSLTSFDRISMLPSLDMMDGPVALRGDRLAWSRGEDV